MKKSILSLIALALVAFAFNSCDDVPMPYGEPSAEADTTKVVPTGSGTAADPYNVAMVNELYSSNQLSVGDEIYVKGVITNLRSGNYSFSEQYHNYSYCINDVMSSDGEFTIFQGKYLGNKDFTSADQLQVGDTVVVFGKLTTYNEQPQLDRGNYIYSLNGEVAPEVPSIANTAETAYTVAQAIEFVNNGQAGNDSVYVKGIITTDKMRFNSSYNSITYYISDDGGTDNHLQIYSGKGLNGADFSAASDLKAGQTVVVYGLLKDYNGNPEIDKNNRIISISGGTSTETGDGTEANPYTASQAYSLASALDASGKIEGVYITGTVSSVKEVSTKYGNATFNISDDGTTSGNQFTIYRCKYIGGEKFTSEDQVKVGDKVVVKGDIVNYKGNTPETSQGGQIVSINGGGNTSADKGTSAANPYSPDEVISIISAGGYDTSTEFYVKGIIVSVKSSESNILKYGNADYYISSDGTSSNQLQVFRGKYIDGAKFDDSNVGQLQAGKTVVVCGKFTEYNGTPEIAQGSKIISIE